MAVPEVVIVGSADPCPSTGESFLPYRRLLPAGASTLSFESRARNRTVSHKNTTAKGSFLKPGEGGKYRPIGPIVVGDTISRAT